MSKKGVTCEAIGKPFLYMNVLFTNSKSSNGPKSRLVRLADANHRQLQEKSRDETEMSEMNDIRTSVTPGF